ncbi:MFS transporter [Curtobacterium sp. S6]|uniref:MFS transporter n=1 Tax=Curtobacterium sp. S6 TaxID=1479623 RepID=UPI000566B86A|nr:MFS transporter [Curtobacterium sp. S6]
MATPQSSESFAGEQKKILALTLVPLFMSLLSVSIVNVVLPSVQDSLGAGSSALQWVLSGYALAFGVLLVAAGRAGDVYGRGPLFMAGVGLFGLGALVSGLAPSVLVLNIARVAMGLGSGLLNPQTIGLIQQYFKGAARGKAFGMFGGVVGVSVAIGPVLGGVLVALFGESIGWRASFLVNVPICVIALLLAKAWLPESAWKPVPAEHSTSSMPVIDPAHPQRRPKADLDPVGLVSFGLAVLLVMLPFVESSVGPWIWGSIVVGAGLMAFWVWWERRYRRRGGEPMIDMDLFATRSFANGTMLIGLYFVGVTSIWVLVALYMQSGLHHTALASGMMGLPAAAASAISAPIAGRYIVRIGRPLVLIGMSSVLFGLLTTALLVYLHGAMGLSEWWMLLSLTFVGGGQGLVVSPNQTLTLADVPMRYAGSAGGVLQTGQRVGTSIGIAAITGIVFAMVARSDWPTAMMTGLLVIAVVVIMAGCIGVRDMMQGRGEAKAARASS